MPNGKGQIDCCYCIYFESEYEGSDAMYEKGFCNFHKAEIPSLLPTWNHRICKNIELNKHYDFHLQFVFLEKRIQMFETILEEKVLYEFPYNVLSEITKLKDL